MQKFHLILHLFLLWVHNYGPTSNCLKNIELLIMISINFNKTV